METKSAPALLPALGLVAGALLSELLEVPPGTECVWLAALGLALGRPSGKLLAFLALGLISARVQWTEPHLALKDLDPRRPVVIQALVSSHPVRLDGEIRLRATTRFIRQGAVGRGGVLARVRLDLLVTLPQASAGPPIGTELRLRGYLRRSKGFANTRSVRPGAWRFRLKSASFLETLATPGAVARLSAGLRSKAEQALAKGESAAKGEASGGLGLARALLLGDRSALPITHQQVLRRWGLAHLLAVSGLHVGLLAGVLYLLFAPAPRALRLGAMMVGVLGYLLLIGPGPAISRASVMGFLGILALAAHRPPQALNAVAWGAALLVSASPSVVLQLGFQLSFAATTAMIMLSPVYATTLRSWPRWLRQPVAASLAAQIATFPLLLPYTGSWHPLATFFNLLAIPWLALFLLVAFPWVVLQGLSAMTGLTRLLDLLAAPLAAAAELGPSGLDLGLIGPSMALGVGIAGILGLALANPWRGPPFFLVLCLLAFTGSGPATVLGPGAELVMLDVGQGDAILLRDGRAALLIDGGGWRRGDIGGRVLLPALAAVGVESLDAVLMTHSDLDHCGGLADLVRYLPVGEVWTGPLGKDTLGKDTLGKDTLGRKDPRSNCAERLLAAPGPSHRMVRRGDTLRLGRWRLDVLHPGEGEQGGGKRGSENDRSVVLMARLGLTRVLLTGDLEAAGERNLLDVFGQKLDADVLKVGHHGSKTSTTRGLLDAVTPRLALVSAGHGNLYGHPAKPVLERLRRSSVRVLRTDRSGRLRLLFEENGRIHIAPGAIGW